MFQEKCSILFAIKVCVVFFLGGCGFHPLHQHQSSEKYGVFIKEIPDRLGQILRWRLKDRLMDDDVSSSQSPYNLFVTTKVEDAFVSFRRDGTSYRKNITLICDFQLKKTGQAKAIYEDSLRITTAYNIGQDVGRLSYGALQGKKHAEYRAAQLMADEIALMVVSFLKRQVKN
jgi:hypothetical protein